MGKKHEVSAMVEIIGDEAQLAKAIAKFLVEITVSDAGKDGAS